jgi:hypothetical protein
MAKEEGAELGKRALQSAMGVSRDFMAASSIDLARFRRRLEFVPILLGLVLIVAAVLKTYQAASEPILETEWVSSRNFQLVVVEWEVLLGLLLLTGVVPRAARVAALATFATFAIYNVYQIYSREASCGCFGKLSIDPMYTFWFDVAAVVALGLWEPESNGPGILSSRFAGVLAVYLAAGTGAGLGVGGMLTSTLDKQGKLSGSGKYVLLEPQLWVGNRLPLLDYIDIGDQLAKGEWIVVFYRYNCPRCKSAMPRYRRNAQHMIQDHSRARFALVEMAPYGDLGMATEPCVRGTLSDSKRWIVQAPIELQMKDGRVLAVEMPWSKQSPTTSSAPE